MSASRTKLTASPEGRIRGERFAQGVERDVIRAPSFVDFTNTVFRDDELAAQFDEIVDCLLEGKLVPEKYYRHRIGQTPDPLLVNEGIKHLHLGGRDSDIILFLIEYADRVVILEINDHKHFASKPSGSLLLSLHHACLAAQDSDAERRQEVRIQTRREILLRNLRSRAQDD